MTSHSRHPGVLNGVIRTPEVHVPDVDTSHIIAVLGTQDITSGNRAHQVTRLYVRICTISVLAVVLTP